MTICDFCHLEKPANITVYADEWLNSDGHEVTTTSQGVVSKIQKKVWLHISSLITNLDYEVAADVFALPIGLSH